MLRQAGSRAQRNELHDLSVTAARIAQGCHARHPCPTLGHHVGRDTVARQGAGLDDPADIRVSTLIMATQCYCIILRKAARRLTARYDAALAPLGLNLAQFSLLRNVERTGPVSLTTRMQWRARARLRAASSAVNTTIPLAAPGDTPSPVAIGEIPSVERMPG